MSLSPTPAFSSPQPRKILTFYTKCNNVPANSDSSRTTLNDSETSRRRDRNRVDWSLPSPPPKSYSIGCPSTHFFFFCPPPVPAPLPASSVECLLQKVFPPSLSLPIATASVGTAVKEKEVDALGRTDLSIRPSFLLPARGLALSWGPVRRGHGCFAWGSAGRLGSSHGPSSGRWSVVRLLFLFLPREWR